MSWTDDRIAILKKMWKEGKSAAEIAKTLGKGVTRNAVIGKAHRMGLSGRPSPIKKSAAGKAKKKKKETAKKTATSKKAAAPRKPAAAPAAPARDKKGAAPLKDARDVKAVDANLVPPGGGGVSLLELTERMCKWPIGDPREDDFTFCGLPIRPGTPYCPEHAAMAYQSSSRSRAAAAANEDKDKKDTEDEDIDDDDIIDDDDDDDDEATA